MFPNIIGTIAVNVTAKDKLRLRLKSDSLRIILTIFIYYIQFEFFADNKSPLSISLLRKRVFLNYFVQTWFQSTSCTPECTHSLAFPPVICHHHHHQQQYQQSARGSGGVVVMLCYNTYLAISY